jgi:hypothetical protein
MTQYKSLYPPISHFSVTSQEWYIIAGGIWHSVDRRYSWPELESLWEKISFLKPASNDQKHIEPIRYTAEGSKGKTYEVVNDNNSWSCTCPAFGFSRGNHCKHIKSLI